jgi:polyhydroxyalkanoate synthesis regulator protein
MVNPGAPLTVKLHGNRRPYAPGAAGYVTVSDPQARIPDGIAVLLRDAATGADITDDVRSSDLQPARPQSPRRTEH